MEKHFSFNNVGSSPHSLGKWLNNGAAQNSPDFAEAFKCKAESPTSEVKKCEVS